MKRPIAFYPLCLIHLFLAVGALYGGGSLILSPDGSLLGMPAGSVANSPFGNFLIPGLILFIFNGLFPLFILTGLIWKPDWRWANALNIYPDRHWAWAYSLYSGIIVIIWITVQLVYVPPFILQPIFIGVGLAILILSLTPGVMRFFQH
jgi:hypothetical protein